MNIGSIQDEWDLSWRLRTKKGPATFPNRSKTIFRKSKMKVRYMRKQNIRSKKIDTFFKTIHSLLFDHDIIAFSILYPFFYKSNVSTTNNFCIVFPWPKYCHCNSHHPNYILCWSLPFLHSWFSFSDEDMCKSSSKGAPELTTFFRWKLTGR